MGRNWIEAAGRIWEPLVDAAAHRRTLHYEDIKDRIPTSAISVGRALGPIQSFCMDTLRPPLTAIVIGKQTGLPGNGFIAADLASLPRVHEEVFDYPWRLIKNPFGRFGPTDSADAIVERLLADPDRSADIYRLARDRGVAQRLFRRALMKAYSSCCAVCDLGYVEALQAAHIIPWDRASPQQRMDVRNGLLLCGNHHALFDAGVVSVDLGYCLRYRDHGAALDNYSFADECATAKLHGKKINLPDDERLWPRMPVVR